MGIAMMPQIGRSGTPDLSKAAPLWVFEFFNHLIYLYNSEVGQAEPTGTPIVPSVTSILGSAIPAFICQAKGV